MKKYLNCYQLHRWKKTLFHVFHMLHFAPSQMKHFWGEQLIPLSSFPTPSADYQMDSSPASFGYCHAGW